MSETRTADETVIPERQAKPGVYEGPYWVVGASKRGCVSAESESAATAEFKTLTGEDPIKCGRLPYHADPRLNYVWYPADPKYYKDGKAYGPSFCFNPDRCIGHSSCPGRRSCCE